MAVLNRTLILIVIILMAKSAGAQSTIGFSHQRVRLQLGDAVVIRVPSPPKGTQRPVTTGRGNDVVRDDGTIGAGGKTGKVGTGYGAQLSQNIQIQSSKKFTISVISQPRRMFPTTLVEPTRMIYLTDIIYTASQQ